MRPGETSRLWRGVILALVSALTYASTFVMSAIVLEGPMDPLTMTLFRFGAVVIWLGVWLYVKRGFIPLMSRIGGLCAAIGVFHFLANFAMMVAITLAPASISIVMFYTFPAVVLILSSLIDRRWPRPVELVTVVLAITGVALTVGASAGRVPVEGVALALAAAVCVAIMMLGTQRMLVGSSSVAVTWNLAVAAVALALVISAVTGTFALPDTRQDFVILAAVVMLYPIALTCAVLAIGSAGAVTVALVLCVEPVLTVIMAVGVRGESLGPQQIGGMALVIGAVVLMQTIRVRQARAA